MSELLNVTLWNTEWATPTSKRGKLVTEALTSGDPEIVCVTEGYTEIVPAGHLICSHEDHGYQTIDGRRKVMLWSRRPWSDVDCGESFPFPSGRFVAGITDTPVGTVRLIGVCIPWKDAHVKSGRKDRQQWEDHLTYLRALTGYLKPLSNEIPIVLLGDFNQRLPQWGQPQHIYESLMRALGSKLNVATEGVVDDAGQRSIDHLAVSNELEVASMEAFSNIGEQGMKLSDHFGLRVQLRSRSAS